MKGNVEQSHSQSSLDAVRPRRSAVAARSLEEWLAQQEDCAKALLAENISPPGAMPGAIIASPSKAHPDYYLHWVRDSAVVINYVIESYLSTQGAAERRRMLRTIMDFVDFSQHVQGTAMREGIGLGQPKFTVTGEPYAGRSILPQNDGPALRAIVLTRLAFCLLNEGQEDLVREKLYDARLPTGTVIKTDLEYVAQRWRDACIGPWEEVWGRHFFTQLVQQRALVRGSLLAAKMGDPGAASWYSSQAKLLGDALAAHWDPRRRYLVAILDRPAGGLCGERRGLDSAVIAASLGGYAVQEHVHEELYPVEHEQVLATAVALERVFLALFPINSRSRGAEGPAIGRFPDDVYDGYDSSRVGNPWPSLTSAFATYHYKVAEHLRSSGQILITEATLPIFEGLLAGRSSVCVGQAISSRDPLFKEILEALRAKGDAFLERVRCHANPDGSMSEQIHWITGFQQGAPSLSLAYVAFLMAVAARRRLCLALASGAGGK
jgi:glucoamylase